MKNSIPCKVFRVQHGFPLVVKHMQGNPHDELYEGELFITTISFSIFLTQTAQNKT